MTITAIQTRYHGYRFRSRLEARWAVFLDAMKIGWEYEAEGFHTSAGPYLPDFRVDPRSVQHSTGDDGPWDRATSGDVYLEVKGAPLSLSEAERLRAFACDPGEPRWIMALGQIPDPRIEMPYLSGWGMGGAGRCWIFGDQLKFDHPYNHHDSWGPTKPDFMDSSFRSMGIDCIGAHEEVDAFHANNPIGRALTAARSARFEHGETEWQ